MRVYIPRYLFVILITIIASGCMEMIPGYRHENWIKYSSKWVGHRAHLPFDISPSDPRDKLVKDVALQNGEREVEFSLSVQGFGGCHYYYKYNPLTGKILDFRFVEAESGDCRSPV